MLISFSSIFCVVRAPFSRKGFSQISSLFSAQRDETRIIGSAREKPSRPTRRTRLLPSSVMLKRNQGSLKIFLGFSLSPNEALESFPLLISSGPWWSVSITTRRNDSLLYRMRTVIFGCPSDTLWCLLEWHSIVPVEILGGFEGWASEKSRVKHIGILRLEWLRIDLVDPTVIDLVWHTVERCKNRDDPVDHNHWAPIDESMECRDGRVELPALSMNRMSGATDAKNNQG